MSSQKWTDYLTAFIVFTVVAVMAAFLLASKKTISFKMMKADECEKRGYLVLEQLEALNEKFPKAKWHPTAATFSVQEKNWVESPFKEGSNVKYPDDYYSRGWVEDKPELKHADVEVLKNYTHLWQLQHQATGYLTYLFNQPGYCSENAADVGHSLFQNDYGFPKEKPISEYDKVYLKIQRVSMGSSGISCAGAGTERYVYVPGKNAKEERESLRATITYEYMSPDKVKMAQCQVSQDFSLPFDDQPPVVYARSLQDVWALEGVNKIEISSTKTPTLFFCQWKHIPFNGITSSSDWQPCYESVRGVSAILSTKIINKTFQEEGAFSAVLEVQDAQPGRYTLTVAGVDMARNISKKQSLDFKVGDYTCTEGQTYCDAGAEGEQDLPCEIGELCTIQPGALTGVCKVRNCHEER